MAGEQQPTQTAQGTGARTGAPAIYGQTDLDYNDYLKVPELLRLQSPLSKPPHHDELLFIIIHQAYELWFKLVLHEVRETLRLMSLADVDGARHHLTRCNRIMEVLVRQIHILETLRPIDFLRFRDHLKPASGFQSLQFREIEFMAGLKDEAYLAFFKNRPDVVEALRRRMAEPDLRTAFWDLLARKGFPADARDVADERVPEAQAKERLARVLLPIYEEPAKHASLYALCEALVDFDEAFALWREHHWRTVERIIGFKMGTGGSSGVGYLRTTTSKKFFPALWAVRTVLGEPA